jgi:uncharacterized protein (TIGR03382 family)
VFLLDIEKDEKGEPRRVLCSATLIGSRTLVTAAHCVSRARWVRASNAPRWSLEAAAWHAVREVYVHPAYDVAHPTDHDLGFALLAEAPDVQARPWNRKSLQGYGGAALRAVGYGTALDPSEDTGVRRSVALSIRDVSGDVFRLGDRQGHGICHGDSGGPSFHVFPDGVERLVGVHSFTSTENCVDGGDVRVDAYASVIGEWLKKKDPPLADPGVAGLVEDSGATPQSCAAAVPFPGLGLAWLFRRRSRSAR